MAKIAASESEIAAFLAKHPDAKIVGVSIPGCPAESPTPSPATPKAKKAAKAKRGQMNGLESDYAKYLNLRQVLGEVKTWQFERKKFELAHRTTYTPDFFVQMADGLWECHETKGWMRDDAAVKIKVAARMFPEYRFVIVKRKKGKWSFKEVPK